MIVFDKHIEILLLDNDCVIVPQLGGFMAHHADACFDNEENVFLPPYRSIGFNPQLKLNDNLLVQSYIENYDLSYPESLRKIEAEVNELRQILVQEGRYELKGIGILYYNNEGKYTFEPCEAGILTPELYGLGSNEIKKLISNNSTIGTPSKNERINKLAHRTRNVNFKKIGRSIASNVAVAAIICFAFLIFAKPIENCSNNETKTIESVFMKDILINSSKGNAKKEVAIIDRNKKTSKIKESKDSDFSINQSENKKTNTQFKQAENKHVEIEKSNSYYTLVLASRVTKNNAKIFVNELHNKGIGDARVLEKKVGAQVICGRYTTENEAYAKLNIMHSNDFFKEAWVMKVQ